MPFREQPLDFVGGPARYPAPDWEAIATVSKIWVPDDETVGWLVLQNDSAIAFLTAAGPDKLGYVIRELVETRLREGAAGRVPVRDTWDAILQSTLHTTPTDEFLPALTADLRAEWGV